LLPPETAPMTEEQHQQAVSALSAMIVSWLNRRHMTEALDRRSNPHSDDDGRPIGDNSRWRHWRAIVTSYGAGAVPSHGYALMPVVTATATTASQSSVRS
jgi:hypothetical protein